MASKQELEKVRDLFGLSHDLLAQAQFPGHVSPKVTECMQFLAFQFQDFKQRAEVLNTAEESKKADAIAAETVTTEAPKA